MWPRAAAHEGTRRAGIPCRPSGGTPRSAAASPNGSFEPTAPRDRRDRCSSACAATPTITPVRILSVSHDGSPGAPRARAHGARGRGARSKTLGARHVLRVLRARPRPRLCAVLPHVRVRGVRRAASALPRVPRERRGSAAHLRGVTRLCLADGHDRFAREAKDPKGGGERVKMFDVFQVLEGPHGDEACDDARGQLKAHLAVLVLPLPKVESGNPLQGIAGEALAFTLQQHVCVCVCVHLI